MFKEDLELREAVFKKIGFYQEDLYFGALKETYPVWRKEGWDRNDWWQNLPPIETDWQVTAEYLVKYMREKGWDYEIWQYTKKEEMPKQFCWLQEPDNNGMRSDTWHEIQNDNIAEAACRAFLEVEL